MLVIARNCDLSQINQVLDRDFAARAGIDVRQESAIIKLHNRRRLHRYFVGERSRKSRGSAELAPIAEREVFRFPPFFASDGVHKTSGISGPRDFAAGPLSRGEVRYLHGSQDARK